MDPILLVDDDPQMRVALRETIRRIGYETVACENGEEALRRLRQSSFSMVVTDMNMPVMDGLRFLRQAKSIVPQLPVLVITGFGTVENAVETMKEGAIDYLMKPFSFEALKKAIEGILSTGAHERDLLTANPEMHRLIALARNAALSDLTILVLGESGTGKELIARYIHRVSKRAERPFVAVNCAAIPDNLLESELFGHEKGAFTGAVEKKTGKFELAHSGTLLLDEVSEMPLALQAKLLRVLQEREIDRVGGKYPIGVDVRVIATTNRDLRKESEEGRFREDLFYRLNVLPLRVPPLRDRTEDVALLSMHFLAKMCRDTGKHIAGFSDEALRSLEGREWRGNLRELENAIQRAVCICSGERIDVEDLMLDEGGNQPVVCGRIRDMEKELILKTLNDVNGNKTKAAKLLGVSVRTIRNKMHEYGQKVPTE
jgi:DNA-binding NtrC family response regulator